MKVNEVRREPCITAGELREKLLEHLKKNPVDIVIIDPAISYDLSRGVKEIVKQSGGVILLSKQGTGDPPPEQPGPDHFYEHLRRAELYKLPENFFASLGQDHSVFNYLRKFFQKKSPMTEKG
jgi:hypothetical protein